MTRKEEEDQIFQKVVDMKRENELLMVIFEEVDDLVKMGYDGPFMGEEVRGIFHAVNEYKKWKKNKNPVKENSVYNKNLNECHAYGLCVSGDPYEFPCKTCPQLNKE